MAIPNMVLVCTDGSVSFTKGKIYLVKNGVIFANSNERFDLNSLGINKLEDINIGFLAKFKMFIDREIEVICLCGKKTVICESQIYEKELFLCCHN